MASIYCIYQRARNVVAWFDNIINFPENTYNHSLQYYNLIDSVEASAEI